MTHRTWFFLVGAAAAITGTLAGCKDDIADPTMGTVEIRLTSPVADGYVDGTITVTSALGDTTFAATDASYRLVLPSGPAQVAFAKECTAVTPSGTISLEVKPGEVSTAQWDVAPSAAGIRVESSMAGAAVLLNGAPTGRVTPTTLECLAPGTYAVSLSLLGAEPVAEQQVELEFDGTKEVMFELTPSTQTRGAVMELLTATECAPCGVVDIAAEELWKNEELVASHGITLEIHHRWQLSLPDAFFTLATHARNVYYGAGSGGHPWRITNGVTRFQGSDNLPIPALVELMTSEVQAYLDDETPPVSLYWMDVSREPGVSLRAVLRVVVVTPVDNPGATHVLAMNYKNNLSAFTRLHGRVETFYRIVRDIQDRGSMQDLGLTNAGDWVDLEFVFDLAGDTQWSEEEMGVVGLVQEQEGQEVLQVRHQQID